MEWKEIIAQISSLGVQFTDKNLQLAVAESCTGGLISAAITEVTGSSFWFDRGFVTYSNLSKQDMLGVSEAMLVKFGAVSKQVAFAMAQGALERSVADVSLSVTGIAGPGGGSFDKPVGTVYFGLAASWVETSCVHQQFSGDRQDIRFQACRFALETLVNLIKDKK